MDRWQEYAERKNKGETWKQIADSEGLDPSTVRKGTLKHLPNFAETALNNYGFTTDDIVGGWIKGEEFSLKVKREKSEVDMADVISKAMKSADVETYRSTVIGESLDDLLVISLADLHIGQRDFENNGNYGQGLRQRVLDSVKSVTNSVTTCNDALVILGNDVIHTDGKHQGTTRGTPQDTAISWDKMVEEAVMLYSMVIEYLLDAGYNVNCIHTMSNHDYHLGYMISLALKHKYPQCDWTVNTKPLNHFLWGQTLISTTHGDGFPIEKLSSIIPLDAKELYSQANYRFCLTGHLHHRQEKDLIGVSLRGLRSSAPTDQWHFESGWVGSPKSFEFFVFSKESGEKARYTFNI